MEADAKKSRARGDLSSFRASKKRQKNSHFLAHKPIDGEIGESHGLWSLRWGTTSCCGKQRVNKFWQLLFAMS